MQLESIWTYICLVCGLLVSWSHGKPLDMDSMRDGLQMTAMNVAGISMEIAQDMKDGNIIPSRFGIGDGDTLSSEEDGRRRRRSSSDDTDPTRIEGTREKRSPCGRYRATTQAAAPPPTTVATTTPELPRRRRRSASQNEIDENDDIIPETDKFKERACEFGDRIRAAIKTTLENMNKVLEAIAERIRNGADVQNEDTEEAM